VHLFNLLTLTLTFPDSLMFLCTGVEGKDFYATLNNMVLTFSLLEITSFTALEQRW